jgi:branched-subunit amino acid transport protein
MDKELIFLFFGMGLVTYLPRVLPMVVLSKIKMPELILRWLRYVPPAVLAALLVPELLLKQGQWHINFENYYLLAAIPTFLVAFWSKSLLLPVVTGMAALLLFHLFAQSLVLGCMGNLVSMAWGGIR